MHVSLAPEALFQIGGLTVTNSMLTGFLTTILLIASLVWASRQLKLAPGGGFAGFIEATSDVVISQAEQVYGSRKLALQYFPLLGALFLFILANNWLALLPGFNTLMLGETPVFRAVTADLNATIALALVSVVLTYAYGIKALGIKGTIGRYISSNPVMSGVGIMEFFLELTRVISFSFRLFGNIFAGEVLLIVIASLAPILGPSPFWGLELFVGFIQAFVFTMLTMIFIAMATTPAHH